MIATLSVLLIVVLLAAGSFFVFLGGFSLVKLSSFFHRIHGPTKASTLGVGCILLASIAYHTFYGSGLHPRELLIAVFLFMTAPVSAHLMSLAALSLMEGRPDDPSHTVDPEGHIRDDDDERAEQQAAERSEAESPGAESAQAEPSETDRPEPAPARD